MRVQKLLLTLLLAVGVAHADVIATMENRAGGLIYLTDVSLKGCGSNGRAVYATSKEGKSIWGCWFVDDVSVHIKWDSGDSSAFPAGAFTLMKKNKGTDL